MRPRPSRVAFALAFASLATTAACGDDGGDGSIDVDAAAACTPTGSPALPTTGTLIAPSELPLPETCVVGGLRDLPGRWFIANLEALFSFSYPKFQGDCTSGWTNPGGIPLDTDDTDGRSYHIWTDGTVYFTRRFRRFNLPGGGVYEYVQAQSMCMTPDGNLALAFGDAATDVPTVTSTGTGTRFALKDGPSLGLTRVGSINTWGDGRVIDGYNVVVDGDYAYVCGPEGLDIIDVSDPASPQHTGHIGGPDERDGFNDVRVVRGNGHVVAFASALGTDLTYVIDVTTPSAPVFLADIPEYSHSVQVQVKGAQTLLYLATYTTSIPVYDITDPTQPVRLGAYDISDPEGDSGIHDLTVDGDVLYANNTTDGLVVVDGAAGINQPTVERFRLDTTYSHASWVATLGGKKVVIHGDEGMTPEGGAFMRILDAEPASPTFGQELSRFKTRREVGIHNMQIVGTKAYVSYYQDGVRILDLSNPAQPREIAHYNTWSDDTATGAAFEGAVGYRPGADGLSYVADIQQGLIILRETPQ